LAKRNIKFKTETRKLLDLVIHSLYSHSEIFLRELISNASDAIDRLRFLRLTNKELAGKKIKFRIKVSADKEKKELIISDNGIGMGDKELIENIGTIARSGTGAFLESLDKDSKKIPEFIGQFGVGFYSSFMIADKVIIETKMAGATEAYRWESDGGGDFSIETIEKENVGTDIILHLNDNHLEYLEEHRIRTIVKKYSDFIEYPVVMDVEQVVTPEKDGKPAKTKIAEETLNSQQAIWMKTASKVKDEEYQEFYKHISNDFQEPLEKIHYHAEGLSEFNALLYLPAHTPFDLMFSDDKPKGIQLYVKRVFIMDDAEALMPRYLRFVKGVVDSADLPLNVSREILQKDRQLQRIKTSLVKKVLDTLKEKMTSDREAYDKFFKELGGIVKEGIAVDYENKEKILNLLLFESTTTKSGETTSLEEYISRMPEEQKEIYVITGEKRLDLENSPYLESLKNKNFEVLFLLETIDELILQHMNEFQGKKFKLITKGTMDLEEGEAKEKKQETLNKHSEEFKGLLEHIQKKLDENVKEVRLTNRLVSSPVCLVTDEQDMGANMERLMKAMRQDVPPSKRILEINPEHKMIQSMHNLYKGSKSSLEVDTFIDLLYNQAIISEGGRISDPGHFLGILTDLMSEKLDRIQSS